MREILLAQNIHASYGKKEVLNGVSISIKEGEIVALIGPNGAGKSTMLKVLSGFLIPKQGKVIFNGIEITNEDPHIRIRRGLGYFIQGGEIFRTMTVEENLEMGGMRSQKAEVRSQKLEVRSQKGEARKEDGKWKMENGSQRQEVEGQRIENGEWKIRSKITKEDIYRLFPGLYEKRKLAGALLSGGERQALAIGMILMTQPKLLLLDEPSAGLAPTLVKDVLEKIMKINREWGITVLVVEQNVREVLSISHRAYVMKLGTIYTEGSPEALQKGNILEDAFLK